MNASFCKFIVLIVAFAYGFGLPASGTETARSDVMRILHDGSASPTQILAAREVQRYLYLRTGELIPVSAGNNGRAAPAIVLKVDPSLGEEAYRLQTIDMGGAQQLVLSGGDDVALLYAAYGLAAHLGVGFALHGDIVPDERIELDLLKIDEKYDPLFDLRGILPFHDFTEGPDWWNADDYKAYLAQLAKLRMNFLGMHCYPEGPVGPEPLVWIGLPGDIAENGRVEFSAPARWASTRGGAWGYADLDTSDFSAGAHMLFPTEVYGPDVTAGHRPMPGDFEGANEIFNRAATMLDDVFTFGRLLGMKYCIGTEAPLTIPDSVKARVEARGLDPNAPETIERLYRGIFDRIDRAHGADYYWLWTPEGWTWSGTTNEQVEATIEDLRLAERALEQLNTPIQLATCGWVLGPPSDRALFDAVLDKDIPLSCINRQVGFDPVEPAFASFKGRSTWAIPWLEDDPAMIIPQLWAGRMRRDAADALAYGCDGLIGIHWRTRVIDPNIAALAAAAWEQEKWNPQFDRPAPMFTARTKDVHRGGTTADYAENEIAGTDEDRVYETCRWNVDGYILDVPEGEYDVTLKFCEVHYHEPSRRVFGVRLQGKQVVTGLDVFDRVGANAPLDLTFENINVGESGLRIDFTREIEFPFVAGIDVTSRDVETGNDDEGRARVVRRINCGGGAVGAYEADLPAYGEYPELMARDRDLPCTDFYVNWAGAQFGSAVADRMATIFAELDGGEGAYQHGKRTTLPRPSDWRAGPGGIVINPAPWEKERERYAFIERIEALRPKVVGAANLERFDYWLNTFRYLRAVGEIGCARGELDAIVQRIESLDDPAQKRETARVEALTTRIQLARLWEELMALQLSVVSTPGELGTIANLEQHVRTHNRFLSIHDDRIAGWLRAPLPDEVTPGRQYQGEPRLIVPTVRTVATEGERLRIRCIVLSHEPVARVSVGARPIGSGPWWECDVRHIGRRVYEGVLPAIDAKGLEYTVNATLTDGSRLRWPDTPNDVGQTVVAIP